MDPSPIAVVLAKVARFTDRVAAEAETLPAAPHRELFARIVAELRETHAKAETLIPDGLADLHRLGREQLARAEALQAEIAARAREVEAAAAPAAPAPPPPPAAPPPDPGLGARLRAELLAALAEPGPAAAPPRPGKDVWEDWQ